MVNENPISKRLTLKLNKGTDPESGKVIVGSLSVSRIKTEALAEDLYQMAEELAGLLQYPLYTVQVVDTVELLSI
ncbi:MAG: DUF1659 domain-containing protein [Caldiserica bacterium]|jgi:hypothetical protein|nr:DUF1659 domain-containing protein [Caldisericota bacterium]